MIRKKLTLFFKFCAALGLFIALQQLIELRTFGFCTQRIQAEDLSFHAEWETTPLPAIEKQQVGKLLSQPFHLMGAGSECFTFMSEDGQTVIKFFKLDQLRPVYFKKGLFVEDYSAFAGTISNHPAPSQHWLKRLFGIREFRIQRTFNSIKLAYDGLKEETALLYLHLNPTDHFHRTITLIDGNGIQHSIDLDTTRFYLQKRTVPLQQHFSLLHKNEQSEEAKASIDSLLNLILVRCKKGFSDRDLYTKNFGFIGTQAFEYDTGSFHRNIEMCHSWNYHQELFYATLELKCWLKKHYPEMVSYLEEKVSEEIKHSS